MDSSSDNDLDISLESISGLEPGDGEVKVLIRDEAIVRMREHGQGDTRRECGGVMLGEVMEGKRRTRVLVEEVIPAAHTTAQRGSVTFTHDTWEQINREQDERYPDLRIVGWYHTHPGFGIFLSEYDQFIQRNFFDLPWHVAFVLDPISGESGCFGWSQGQIARLSGYEVYGPSEAVPVLPQAAPAATTAPTAWPSQAAGLVTVLLLVGILILSIINLTRVVQPVSPMPAAVGQTQGAGPPTAELTKPGPELAPAKPEYRWYTVQEGDTLWDIARRFYDRGDMWGLIAAENGLVGRETELSAGMRLRIPLPPRGDQSGAR